MLLLAFFAPLSPRSAQMSLSLGRRLRLLLMLWNPTIECILRRRPSLMRPCGFCVLGHGQVRALAHPHPKEGCVNPPQAQECHHWPSHGWVPQPAAGPPMLIGGSEALGGMQISPALLRYPSVPLPVLSNPLIPPDWRRGGRGGEHSCWFVASFPWAQAVSREGGEGRGWGHRGRCCLD